MTTICIPTKGGEVVDEPLHSSTEKKTDEDSPSYPFALQRFKRLGLTQEEAEKLLKE